MLILNEREANRFATRLRVQAWGVMGATACLCDFQFQHSLLRIISSESCLRRWISVEKEGAPRAVPSDETVA